MTPTFTFPEFIHKRWGTLPTSLREMPIVQRQFDERRVAFAVFKLQIALEDGVHSQTDAAELWVRFRYYCYSFRVRGLQKQEQGPEKSYALCYNLIERVAYSLLPWQQARSSAMLAAVHLHRAASACAACAA